MRSGNRYPSLHLSPRPPHTMTESLCLKVARLRLKWPINIQLNFMASSTALLLLVSSKFPKVIFKNIFKNRFVSQEAHLGQQWKAANGPSLAFCMNHKLLHTEQRLRGTVFAACFHSDFPSCSELLPSVPHPVDCIMIYIYCTNTLSGSLHFSHKANMHLHGDSWGIKMKIHQIQIRKFMW